MRSDAERVCTDASWFLSKFDPLHGEFLYIRTSRERLDATAFHDGRTSLSTDGATTRISIDDAIRWQDKQGECDGINRLIVHSSFCGSTLLARALGRLENAVSYREPQALIECADFASSGPSMHESDWSQLTRFVIAQYRKVWERDEIAFVKPSNWVTWHLAEAVEHIRPTKVTLVSQDLKSYLLANLRGGKARLKYSLELLNSFARSDRRYGPMIKAIEQASPVPMTRVLRLLVLCFRIQESAMLDIQNGRDANLTLALSRSDIVSDPEASLGMAARFFDIPFDKGAIEKAASAQFRINAKSDLGGSWNAHEEARQNSSLWDEFRSELSDSLSWGNTEFSGVES